MRVFLPVGYTLQYVDFEWKWVEILCGVCGLTLFTSVHTLFCCRYWIISKKLPLLLSSGTPSPTALINNSDDSVGENEKTVMERKMYRIGLAAIVAVALLCSLSLVGSLLYMISFEA